MNLCPLSGWLGTALVILNFLFITPTVDRSIFSFMYLPVLKNNYWNLLLPHIYTPVRQEVLDDIVFALLIYKFKTNMFNYV